ncbi:integrase family protein [Marine Group I thaumarchaeote SCGC AAA799-B03]|uniref:Integrase family protein n=1 Tax=Marine Group I thaumarchaeote SCGC AAA799-B03 TaxID=1502289 RepID=A0A087S8F0_9ARCH|nr:integrase family protein [Marine Group I thaumarchaeote SCGC AAA799-B03]
MAVTKIQRSKESFLTKITNLNESTQDSIKYTINNFENFCMEKYGNNYIIPDLKKSTDEEIYDVLQNWINWNGNKAPRSVRTLFSHLRKYLHYMSIKLNQQDINAELDFSHSVEDEKYGMTHTDIQQILNKMRYKHMVQYLCQSSSLMRIGEIIQLRKKHLILGQKNIIVRIPSTIAKFNKARTTFFSKEASRLLIPLLKKIDDDDLVFGTSDNPKLTPYQNKVNSQSATKQVLRLAAKRAGLDMTYESTGRYLINTHSFRAFGITKLSRHDPNFAKKLAGQKGYLLEYDRMSDEEKLDIYEKYENELIIDNSLKLKKEKEILESKVATTEKLRARIKALEEEKNDFAIKLQNKSFTEKIKIKDLSPELQKIIRKLEEK